MSLNINHKKFQEYIQDPREAPASLLEKLDVSRSKWKNMGKEKRHNVLKSAMEVSGNTIREGAPGVHGSKKLGYMPYHEGGTRRRRCMKRQKTRRNH